MYMPPVLHQDSKNKAAWLTREGDLDSEVDSNGRKSGTSSLQPDSPHISCAQLLWNDFFSLSQAARHSEQIELSTGLTHNYIYMKVEY